MTKTIMPQFDMNYNDCCMAQHELNIVIESCASKCRKFLAIRNHDRSITGSANQPDGLQLIKIESNLKVVSEIVRRWGGRVALES